MKILSLLMMAFLFEGARAATLYTNTLTVVCLTATSLGAISLDYCTYKYAITCVDALNVICYTTALTTEGVLPSSALTTYTSSESYDASLVSSTLTTSSSGITSSEAISAPESNVPESSVPESSVPESTFAPHLTTYTNSAGETISGYVSEYLTTNSNGVVETFTTTHIQPIETSSSVSISSTPISSSSSPSGSSSTFSSSSSPSSSLSSAVTSSSSSHSDLTSSSSSLSTLTSSSSSLSTTSRSSSTEITTSHSTSKSQGDGGLPQHSNSISCLGILVIFAPLLLMI